MTKVERFFFISAPKITMTMSAIISKTFLKCAHQINPEMLITKGFKGWTKSKKCKQTRTQTHTNKCLSQRMEKCWMLRLYKLILWTYCKIYLSYLTFSWHLFIIFERFEGWQTKPNKRQEKQKPRSRRRSKRNTIRNCIELYWETYGQIVGQHEFLGYY